jgi:flagellar basal body-associated protein FliL
MKTQTTTRKILIYVITVLLTIAIVLLSLVSCSGNEITTVDQQNKILLSK